MGEGTGLAGDVLVLNGPTTRCCVTRYMRRGCSAATECGQCVERRRQDVHSREMPAYSLPVRVTCTTSALMS